MTNSRRTHPVPQLKCVGGTAGCSAFTPSVVQCYNRGSDGYDVQVNIDLELHVAPVSSSQNHTALPKQVSFFLVGRNRRQCTSSSSLTVLLASFHTCTYM